MCDPRLLRKVPHLAPTAPLFAAIRLAAMLLSALGGCDKVVPIMPLWLEIGEEDRWMCICGEN